MRLTVVQCHLTAALRGYRSQQLGYRWGSQLNPKYVAWIMRQTWLGSVLLSVVSPLVPKRWV